MDKPDTNTHAIDPKVELLADIPILGAQEDLFEHRRLARRLIELAVAVPMTVPRVLALTGPSGAGKSSVLQMVSELVVGRHGLAMVLLDAQLHVTAQALMTELATELSKVFRELGVARGTDKVRDTLVTYGGLVSSVIRLAGVTVDVSSALGRSADSLRAEIARDLEQANTQLIVVIDHLDQLSPEHLRDAFAALRMYAAIPHVAIVIAVDRRAVATCCASTEPHAFERFVQTELAMPSADRTVLARVIAGGLKRIAARTGRDLEPALELFDAAGGVGLALIDTPRDAKRAINALSAALPLLPPEADACSATLEIVLRVSVPQLDATRLAAHHRVAEPDRDALLAELTAAVAPSARASAARDALRVLLERG